MQILHAETFKLAAIVHGSFGNVGIRSNFDITTRNCNLQFEKGNAQHILIHFAWEIIDNQYSNFGR